MTETVTVALVDDQQLVRAGLRMILEAESDITVVGEAADGAAGLALISDLEPDVVLMDIRMPVLDGISATRQLGPDSATKVLVLTTFDTDEAVVSAIRAGASGFLLKDAEPDDLIRAVRAVAVGDAVVAPTAMRRLLNTLAPELPKPEPRDPALLAALTEREVEVLALIGAGLTNAEIGIELVVAESTVKTHVGRILMKLGARDRVQMVIMAYRAGIVS